MSMLDKAIAALTPPVSPEKRREAHDKARSAAEPGDWLSMVLDHHEEIEAAFAKTKAATTAGERRRAQKRLALLLTGHSLAEEAVIYPALAHAGKQGHANTAYTEQTAAKMQLAALEHLDPMGEDYLDKLGHLEGAVLTHAYQEEHDWFLDLKTDAPASDQAQVTRRYAEEYGRYMGQDGDADRGSSVPSRRPSHVRKPDLGRRRFNVVAFPRTAFSGAAPKD